MGLTRREKLKIERQLKQTDRGATWVGLRPVVFVSKKYDKKSRRKQSKILCSFLD